MKCDTKTIVKICAAALVLSGLGILLFPQLFPQLRSSLILLLPFAPLATCLAACPLMMFLMRGASKDSQNNKKDS